MQKVISLSTWLATYNACKEYDKAINTENKRERLHHILKINPGEAINLILWSENLYPHIAWGYLHNKWEEYVRSFPQGTKFVYFPVLLKKV